MPSQSTLHDARRPDQDVKCGLAQDDVFPTGSNHPDRNLAGKTVTSDPAKPYWPRREPGFC